jgi:hypothetical protein
MATKEKSDLEKLDAIIVYEGQDALITRILTSIRSGPKCPRYLNVSSQLRWEIVGCSDNAFCGKVREEVSSFSQETNQHMLKRSLARI